MSWLNNIVRFAPVGFGFGFPIIGGFVCGFSGSSMLPFKGLVSGLMCCVPYTILMYILMFIFSDGKLSYSSLLLILVIIASSSIGGITNANIKRRK